MFGPAFFAHQGTAPVERGEGFGCECAVCGRKIAAPHRYQRAVIWCLYCGMERGFVPMVEMHGGLEFTFGITRDECQMVRDNLHRLDDWMLERDRSMGRVLFEIG